MLLSIRFYQELLTAKVLAPFKGIIEGEREAKMKSGFSNFVAPSGINAVVKYFLNLSGVLFLLCIKSFNFPRHLFLLLPTTRCCFCGVSSTVLFSNYRPYKEGYRSFWLCPTVTVTDLVSPASPSSNKRYYIFCLAARIYSYSTGYLYFIFKQVCTLFLSCINCLGKLDDLNLFLSSMG